MKKAGEKHKTGRCDDTWGRPKSSSGRHLADVMVMMIGDFVVRKALVILPQFGLIKICVGK